MIMKIFLLQILSKLVVMEQMMELSTLLPRADQDLMPLIGRQMFQIVE